MEEIRSAKVRRSHILQQLSQKSEVLVSSLSKEYGVSEVTIRKDLNELRKRNLLLRTRGGAMRMASDPELSPELTIQRKQMFNRREKHAGETLFIDSGTTTHEVARNLEGFNNLTIITNAIDIALELARYGRFKVILLGGLVRASSYSTIGPIAESMLKNFYVDKLFLGVDSFNAERGISTPNIEEAHINQTMISMSKEVIGVFDSSKFNKRSFAFIAPVTSLHTVVTDNGILPEMKRKIKQLGIQLVVAPAE